jgi:NAD(P)-dependent dehydrogenase (short-subunit alcohol dehydrogenase family)
MSAYCASKAGVEAFADSLRIEVQHHGVDVGCAYFSWIDTEMVRGADRHDFGAHLRGKLSGPFAKTYPVEEAADAVVRGMERRARWVVHPGWVRSMILLRGFLQPVADWQAGRNFAEAEQVFIAQQQRDGAAASAAVGAGGAADPVATAGV